MKISERRQFLTERQAGQGRLTIGFAGIADLRSFIGLEYIKGMMQACEDYGINFINMGGAVKSSLFDDINFLHNYIKNFQFMKKPLVDGLVTWTSSFWDFMTEEKIRESFSSLNPLPMVDIGYMDIPGVTHLKIDSNKAIRKMIDHLTVRHNYTKFAFFGADTSAPHWNRLNVYKKELKLRGLLEIENSVFMTKSMSDAHIAEKAEEMIKLHELKEKKTIDAIITTSDIIAAKLIEYLARKNISVPADVAVTGFNNWYEGITARSPLTTVDLCYFKRGYAAVEMLIDRIADTSIKAETVLFDPEIVIRQSCGCLENSIKITGTTDKEELKNEKRNVFYESEKDESPKTISENEVRTFITEKCRNLLPKETEKSILKLVKSFFEDLYSKDSLTQKNNGSKMLQWYQDLLQAKRAEHSFEAEELQNYISNFRKIFLPAVKEEGAEAVIKIENIFHQMRILVSVFQKYESIAERENPYSLNNISEQALMFTHIKSTEDIFHILKKQLYEFDIKGAVLALGENSSLNFPVTTVKMIFPENKELIENLKDHKIYEPNFFPKNALPADRRYSVMLEVLHIFDRYFGYAFFEITNPNIAIYDVLRMLLSSALNSLNSKQENNSNNLSSAENPKHEIQQSFTFSGAEDSSKRSRITVGAITKYLISIISEKTDIQKAAAHFMVSRSYLSQKTKELTGHTIQELHEKLKIEEAKSMLRLGQYGLNEIAAKLGFKNQNYFSTVFKKNTGLSPKSWQKQKE